MARKNGKAEGTPAIGHNSLSEQGKKFVERIENLQKDIENEKTSYKEAVTGIRADIALVLAEAVQAGIPKVTIKAVVKARTLERKADAAREALDIADRDSFDNIRLALGDLAELPLGKAVLGEEPASETARE